MCNHQGRKSFWSETTVYKEQCLVLGGKSTPQGTRPGLEDAHGKAPLEAVRSLQSPAWPWSLSPPSPSLPDLQLPLNQRCPCFTGAVGPSARKALPWRATLTPPGCLLLGHPLGGLLCLRGQDPGFAVPCPCCLEGHSHAP